MGGRLDGKTAVVIGAAQGIGAGIAEVMAEQGARMVIADRNADVGRETAERLSGHSPSIFVQADVSKKADMAAVAATALERFGRIDILCQNAGIFPYHLIDEIDESEWDQVLAVNLKGVFLAFQACYGAMKRQRYGRVIFTSSITGPRVSAPGHGHYSASKAGINGFIRAAAIEAAPFNLTVNGVEPGNILTEGMKAHRSHEFIRSMEEAVPLGRLGTPRDIANAALFLASDDASYITGTTIVVDGGLLWSYSEQ